MSAKHRVACVIGYPAKHSRSPMLHRYWINKYGLDADYRAEEVAPDKVAGLIGDLAGHGYVGANVTMPHKEIALAMSAPDERALAVGAANTLWLENGTLRSTNTDVEGFLLALDAASAGWDNRTRTAIIIGAGGAARAIVFGLLERGISEIHVINRTLGKAEAMRERFGTRVHAAEWDALPKLLIGAQLLVNTTSLGMHGQEPLELDLTSLEVDAVVADIVYVPLQTRLLRQAEELGFATSNGLDMLLYQAVRGFELWFGVRPEVTRELYSLLASDISGG